MPAETDAAFDGAGADEDRDSGAPQLAMRTPCARFPQGSGTTVWAKLEYLQPSGSTKDRFAAHVLGQALTDGTVGPTSTVVEASSGSTSIAFAMACARLGLRFTAVVPESVSRERLMIIRRLGADVVLTPASDGIRGAADAAERLAAGVVDSFSPRQFKNIENARAHESGTGRELLEQVPGSIDAFVAGVGTGGTLAGVGCALRRSQTDVLLAEAIPVDPGSGEHLGIPGIVTCMSELLDETDIVRRIRVTEADALDAARRLCRAGLPVGLSSGLNFAAACALASELAPGSNVATVLPDRMERYFSGALFADLAMA